MQSRYDYKQTEENIYKLWEDANAFNPDTVIELRKKDQNPVKDEKFSIIMPPPNANDPLHVGHAIFVSLEDIMIRYNRMLGKDTVWIPGTDHAGIETQFVFEKKLKAKKQSRFNFDRSTLFDMIWEYVQENSGVAIDQIKKLGASADWSRYKFTLDKDIVSDVLDTFQKLYSDGLIYRDLKLVNFCTKCGTSYSELEVNHKEQIDPLYTIQYGPLTVATVRLETIFGDVAVAVNPNDTRYKQYIGTEIEVEFPWGKKTMPVIADDYVDPEFGTGAVKVTPYHDPNDFLMWTNHKEEIKEVPQPVINTSGKLYNHTKTNNNKNILVPDEYDGLGIVNARKAALAAYTNYKTEEGESLLLDVKEKYTHSVGICYRCSRQIEPLPLPQFFVSVKNEKNNLVENALKALDNKETKVHGAGREKILRHWLNNLKDWNISRQIVWGIGIPVWYKINGNEEKITVNYLDSDKKYTTALLSEALKQYSLEQLKQNIQSMNADISVEYTVSIENPSKDNPENQYLQETDTFDTWFSSSQWPVVTLNNTTPSGSETKDFSRFYPTSVMETGYDILPFWVMRMMLLGIYMTDETPFKDVYLHGLVRDAKGNKMSKSKGNVINPLEVKAEFGADALRMALVIRSTPGQDKSVGTPDFKAMRNLTNKVWNAARFTLMQIEEANEDSVQKNAPQDEEFNKKLNEVVFDVTKQLNDFKLGLAAETVYNEFWHWYCDECIEAGKSGQVSLEALLNGLTVFLKLLHPFMPFVSEAIWQELVTSKLVKEKLLITANWPGN
jgi:valyl-tRNA synthetase